MNMTRRYTSVMLLLIGFGLALLGAQESSYRYPDVRTRPEPVERVTQVHSADEIAQFLSQWNPHHETDARSESLGFAQESATVLQLESLYRIQVAQTDRVKGEGRPVLSIDSDPANPIYGFSRMYQVNPTAPPATNLLLAHRFGLGSTISQRFNTGGSVAVGARYETSYTSLDGGGTYTWQQSPSVTLSFQQPVWMGSRFIDSSYGKQTLEKQLLEQERAMAAVEQTRSSVEQQGLLLYHTLQSLLESRWLLGEQIRLQQRLLSDAQLDYQAGNLSRNELEQRELALDNLVAQREVLQLEIGEIEASIEALIGTASRGVPPMNTSDYTDMIERLLSYTKGNFPREESSVRRALQHDADYADAQRALQTARIDRELGNPGDAPRLSVALQIGSHYTPAATTFGSSVSELFSDGSPEVSVSVSFTASDLSRSLRKSTDAMAEEGIVQATLAQAEAEKAVIDRFSHYQRRVDNEIGALDLRLTEYKISLRDLDIVQIRNAAGLADSTAVQLGELGLYEAAFAVLQQLRTLYALDDEITRFLGLNRW